MSSRLKIDSFSQIRQYHWISLTYDESSYFMNQKIACVNINFLARKSILAKIVLKKAFTYYNPT